MAYSTSAMSVLQEAYNRRTNNSYTRGGSLVLSPAASLYAKQKKEEEEKKKKNRGGFFGGLGYFAEKAGLGLVQGVEGILDYTVGGIADFFGADKFAEDVFESDWLNYNHADDWYNPGEGWKIAGDVAGGIGSSLPGIGAGLIATAASGGAGLAAFIGISTSGLSAAGTSTKEAMQESGKLTGKEYLYGAAMGAVEAATEGISGALGAGLTKTIKSVGTAFGKTAAKAASKGVQSLTVKTAAKQAGKEFLSEAFEEGFSEFISPYAKRVTYDPNAKNASWEEIGYAALVGGLSGVVTGGARGFVTQGANRLSGGKAVKDGRESQILTLAKQMIDDDAGGEYGQAIKQIYDRISPTVESGKELSFLQKRALGELQSYETANVLQGAVQRSAINVVQNAPAIAERLNADGRYKMVDGKFSYLESAESAPEGADVRDITAEDLTNGFDPTKKNGLVEALKTNDALRFIASSDTAGRFMMAAKEFETASLTGSRIKSQAELNNFIETASAERKAAVGKEFEINDWNTLTFEEFNQKAKAYRDSGKAEAYKQKAAKIEEMKGLAESKARNIPRVIALADGGIQHYSDEDSNIAIARTGDNFIIYDYDSGNVTRDMTRAEVNAALGRYRESKVATNVQPSETTEMVGSTDENLSYSAPSIAQALPMQEKTAPSMEQIKEAAEARRQKAEFDTLAKEKVKDYESLSVENKTMIRKVFREARANGISDSDALAAARISARSGLDISFDKKASYKGKNEAGEDVYHAGYYDPENNRIVINPETKRKHASLLIHELSHAIRPDIGKDGKRHAVPMIDDPEKISDAMWEKIEGYYADQEIAVERAELMADEASAYYAEQMLGTDAAIDLLLGEKPTLQKKILSFFKKSAQDYSSDEALSRESRKLLRNFKKTFDAFAARNQGRNAEAGNDGDASARRFAEEDAYSYEVLSKKSDLNVVALPSNTPKTPEGEIDKKAVISRGRFNAKKQNNPNNTQTNTYVRVDDIGLDVLLSKNGMEHGIARSEETALAVMKIGDILKNSVAINELDGSEKRKTEMSYVLLGACQDEKNLYVVRSVVSKIKNDVTEIDIFQLGAIKGKKTEIPTSTQGGTAVGELDSLISSGSRTISITDFLENVKSIPLVNEVFSSNVAKKLGISRSKGSLTTSLRYAMEDIDPAAVALPRKAGTMSVGQYKKRVADLMKTKSYSKDQIYDIVKKLPMASEAMEKTREQVAEAIWQIYNEDLTAGERREAAHDISEFLVARLMTEAKEENPKAAEANEAIAYLRTGIGRLAFSPEDISEIKHNVDKDGWRRILGRWGFKGKRNADGTLHGVRTPMEVFVTDIAREMPGMAYLEDMHPVEAFLEIDAYYSRVKEDDSEKKISAFLSMSDADIESLAKSIEENIVDAYDRGGGKSIFMKRIEQGISYHEQKASRYKQEFNEIKGRDKINGLLMNQAQKMKDLKLGSFANVTEGANETFKKTIGALASIQYRGNLSVTNAKKAIKDLYVWYTSKEVKENLFGFTAEDPGLWQEGVAEMMEALAENESKGFEKAELYALLDVLTYFTHFVENFGKVWHHGEWVDAKELATNYIQVAQNQSPIKHKLVRDLAKKYMQTFSDPAAVVRMMDQYQDGFFTQIFDDLRDAAISARYAEGEILSAYNEFLKNSKRYVENASKETVQYRGVEIPKMHLISLYMTMKRKHAQAGYAINGFSFKTEKGDTVRVRGSLDPDTVYTKQEIEDYVNRERAKIETLLSDADKQYISILEKVYNEDAKRLKADRDIQRFGMTNATSDYYYPIRRANTAQKLDSDMQMEIDRVSSASFNKDTVKGAKQELFIESADKLFNRHVHVVCQYAYLTPVLDMQKMLYNTDISGNPNHPISIHTETQNIWPEGFRFFREMVSDVQGIPRNSSTGMKFLSGIRSNYAKFQLGANPKTWVTQLSSFFASTSLLDASSVMKGLGMSSAGFEQYSKLAKIRVEDNAAAKAQGVLDNKAKRATDSIGDALMAPIGMMDKFVVGRLFGACQVQIEKDGGAKIGSEENRIEAGKLLTRVILETQQNSLSTERSAAMRSGNEFYRALTMFRSDSMKVIGRVIDGFGEVSAIKGLLKNKTMNEDSQKSLEARLDKAKKKTAKAATSLVLSAVFMACASELFRHIYNKERDKSSEEERKEHPVRTFFKETTIGAMLVDFFGNMLGGLPFFADAYSKFVDGYDVGNYSYSAINDVLDSAKSLFNITEDILAGEGTAQERARAIRSAFYSLGQLLGLPTRNVYNVMYGLTKRFSPQAGYWIDEKFYEKNFKNDLYKAIDKGDDKMTVYIMGLLLGERLDQSMSESAFNEILSLTKNGYKVLPRTMPDSLTINETKYELTEDEVASIYSIYSGYVKSLDGLFESSQYQAMSDEQREDAISYVSDLYYDKAISETLGVDRGNAYRYASAIGFDAFAAFKIQTKDIEADTDRNGENIEGSKRKKTIAAINAIKATREEKILMIVASGYALKDGDIRGLSAANAKKILLRYILTMNATKEEKAALAEACGFEVKNGKILKNSL